MAASFWFVSALAILCKYPVPAPKPGDTRNGMPSRDIESAQQQQLQDEGGLELPLEGDATQTIASPDDDKALADTGVKVPDAEIS
eukprot:259657-Ditylum_brightwellii.AAC.1